MAEYVSRATARDGYQSFRIGDSATDGEHGAPMRPVHAFAPLPDGEASEWLELAGRSAGLGDPLTRDERRRMNALLQRMKGEVIGASDDHATEMAMQSAHREMAG